MKLICTLLLVCFSILSEAQRCATDDYLTSRAPESVSADARKSSPAGRDTLPAEVIVVPVVVHILYNNGRQNIPDAQVIAQIDALNRDFRRTNPDTVNTPQPFKSLAADARIVFCLARVDPKGFKTNGIIRTYTKESLFLADDQMKFSSRGGSDAWNPNRYLNIWVCDLFGRTLGYSSMPGGNPAVDGIVIKYSVFGAGAGVTAPYNKGRTLTHETGHWLGLKHIWGDADGGACADDGIDDTPPQSGSNTGCNQFPKLSACSVDGLGDMFMNFMDFSDDACMNLFTSGQARVMRGQFASAGLRNSFLDSDLCDGSGAEEAPPAEDIPPVVRAYPNPAADKIIIESPGTGSGQPLSIYNATGRLLLKKRMFSKKETVLLAAYPDGLYLVLVGEGTDRQTFKILKQSGTKR